MYTIELGSSPHSLVILMRIKKFTRMIGLHDMKKTLKKQSHFQILKINSSVTYCSHWNRDLLECMFVFSVCT